jgi:hypothetical protein
MALEGYYLALHQALVRDRESCIRDRGLIVLDIRHEVTAEAG